MRINSIGAYYEEIASGFTFGTQTDQITLTNSVDIEGAVVPGFEYSFQAKTGTLAHLDDINYLTGTTFNTGNGILSLAMLTGNTITVGLDGRYLHITGSTGDDYVTSGNFNTTSGIVTLTRQSGGTVNYGINGKYLDLSGGTLSGNITAPAHITNGGLVSQFVKGNGSLQSDTFYSLTGHTHSGLSDDYVSSGSFNTTSGIITLTRLSGGTVNYGINGKYLDLTGGTMSNTNLVVNLNASRLNGLGGTFYSLTGHTHSGLSDDYVTSGSFNTTSGVITLTRQSGGTVNYGINGKYLDLSGGTLSGNVTAPAHITTGGLSSQFVKGNGALQSDTFYSLTSHTHSNYISNTGLSSQIVKGDGSLQSDSFYVLTGTTQTISGAKTFNNNTLLFRNPANTFSYTITAGAISAARVLNLPVITGPDMIVVTGLSQTLINKTLTSPIINTQITTASSSLNIFNTVATTANVFGASTAFTLGGTPTGTLTATLFGNATLNSVTKTLNIGTGGASGSITNILLGSATGGAVGTTTLHSTTINLSETPATDAGFSTSTMLVRDSSGNLDKIVASGGGTSSFLRADGSWATPAGGGGGGNITATTTNFNTQVAYFTGDKVITGNAGFTYDDSTSGLTVNGYMGIGKPANGSERLWVESEPNNWGFITTTIGVSNWTGFWADSADNFQMELRDGTAAQTVLVASSGDTFFNGGNVGVGISTPIAKTHISGPNHTAASGSTIVGGVLAIQQSNGTIMFIDGNDIDVSGSTVLSASTLFLQDYTKGPVAMGGNVIIQRISGATTDTDKFLVSDGGNVKYRTGAEVRSDIGAGTGNGDMLLGTSQTVTAAKTFNNNTLLFRNPANTFSYTITAGAISAARVLNLPVITGTDTLATLGLAQTFTVAKTFNNNTLLFRNPANTFSYTITAGAISAARVLNLPVITGTDTLAVLGLAQTFTGFNTFSAGMSDSITKLGVTGNVSLDSVTDTAAEWSNLPVGYSRMINAANAGAPSGANAGYFTKIANRDTSGGWGGLWGNYTGGRLWYGTALDNTVLPTWYEVITTTNLYTVTADDRYLRSDNTDVFDGATLAIADNSQLALGTGWDFRMWHNGTNNYFDMYLGDLYIRDYPTTRFTFGRTTGDLTLATGEIITQGTGNNSMLGNLSVGVTAPLAIEATATNFASSTPKFEIKTGTGTGTYEELITLRHTGADASAVLRKLGFLMKLSSESSAGESDKMCGIWLESSSTFANSPRMVLATADIERMTILSTGNVGIGTTAPDQLLTIHGLNKYVAAEGTSNLWGASTTIGVKMGIPSGGGSGEIDFRRWRGSGTLHSNALIKQVLSTIGYNLEFYNENVATNIQPTTAKMVIAADTGNVGIGTTAPNQSLVVRNGVANTSMKILSYNSATGTEAALKFSTIASETNYEKAAIIVKNAAGSFGRSDMHFALDSVGDTGNVVFADTKMTILNGGNVGIGTTAPVCPFTVNLTAFNTINIGTLSNGQIGFGNGSGSSYASSIVGKSNDNSGLTHIAANNNANTNGDMLFNVRENDNTDFATLTSAAFRWSRFSTTLMNLSRAGNLGIGTTSPDAPLHVQQSTTSYAWSPAAGTSTILESNDSNRNFVTIASTNQSEIWFADAASQNAGRLRYDHTGNNMEIWTSGVKTFDISSAGVITAPQMSTTEISAATGTVLITRDYLDGGTGGSLGLEHVFEYAVSDETSNLSTGTNKLRIRLPFDMTPTKLRINVNTAPTGAAIIVDINLSGTTGFCTLTGGTALTSKLQIDAGHTTSVTSGSPVAFNGLGWGDDMILSVDIDQKGSSVAGAGLKFKIYCIKGVTNCSPP